MWWVCLWRERRGLVGVEVGLMRGEVRWPWLCDRQSCASVSVLLRVTDLDKLLCADIFSVSCVSSSLLKNSGFDRFEIH